MIGELLLVHAGDASPRVNSALSMLQRVPPNVGGQDFHVPRVRKGQGIRDSNGDRIRLFARRAARAPDAQRPRVLPEFLHVQFRQDALFKSFVDSGIAKKTGFLGQQSFEQRLVLHVGFAHAAQQVGSTLEALGAQVFPHTRGEKPLTRFIEANPCPLFD